MRSIIILLTSTLLLSGCGMLTYSKTGTVVIDSRPYELTIAEDAFPIDGGYQIKINGEEVGKLTVKDRSLSRGPVFNPLQTKYGILTAEWKTDSHSANYRFYLDGVYIGTLNYI